MTEGAATTLAWPRDDGAPALLSAARDGNRARLELAVPVDSPWLEGHFPERPVLPGVVLLRWAIEAGGLLWPALGTVQGVANLKFQRPVLPPADLALVLERSDGRLDFRFEREDTVVARGRVRFA